MAIDQHIRIKEPMGANAELNQGIEAAQGDFIIYSQNDIFVRPGWLEALQQCFDECADCGIATVASSDLKGKLPYPMPADLIVEGAYGPFMMFRKGWYIDAETFPCQFGDSDLIARIYESGLRSYRNYRVVIEHLNKATTAGPESDEDFKQARQRFIAKHRAAPRLMDHYLMNGQIV
jgi:GT2 family glycosyltransferase